MDIWMYKDIKIENSMDIEKEIYRYRYKDREIDR